MVLIFKEGDSNVQLSRQGTEHEVLLNSALRCKYKLKGFGSMTYLSGFSQPIKVKKHKSKLLAQLTDVLSCGGRNMFNIFLNWFEYSNMFLPFSQYISKQNLILTLSLCVDNVALSKRKGFKHD